MKLTLRLLAASLILIILGAACALAVPEGFARDFTYKQSDGAVDVLKDGKVVARYVSKGAPKPYVYPVLSPAGLSVTRDYPMKEVAGQSVDHPHQRSLWLGYGDVNGVDFWTEGKDTGKMVQTSIDFSPISPGPYWSIHTTNDWLLANGKKLASDERKIAFYSCKYGMFIVSAIKIVASVTDLKFGDSKEGFYGFRVAPSIAITGGKGHILTSEGDKDDKAWGKRARWIDYTGEVDGKAVGIAMFDSTANYGYPTYWEARDYGLLAADPFGGKAFTGDAKNECTFTVGYTTSAAFTYIALIHDGAIDSKTLDLIANDVGGTPPKPNSTKEPGAPRKNPIMK